MKTLSPLEAVEAMPNPSILPGVSEPFLLNDPGRLPEIYSLRTYAWENSPGRANVNSVKYPNGYRDVSDERSIHFICTDQDEIIAAARLSLCDEITELPYHQVFDPYLDQIPLGVPFLFYSRLVIHPEYRKRGLRQKFDEIRLRTQQEMNIPFGLVTVNPIRTRQLEEYGFQNLGPALPNGSNFPFTDLNVMLLLASDIRLNK